MSNRTREIARINTTSGKVISVEVGYDLGGTNYFTGYVNPRGYYLYVIPKTYTEHLTTVRAFSGVKKLIESATRFSKKRLDTLKIDKTVVSRLVDHVCTKEKLVITDGELERCSFL